MRTTYTKLAYCGGDTENRTLVNGLKVRCFTPKLHPRSERKDLNLRPPGPRPGALRRLSYSPFIYLPQQPPPHVGGFFSAPLAIHCKNLWNLLSGSCAFSVVSFASFVFSIFITSCSLVMAGVEGVEPSLTRFWRPPLYSLSYTPMIINLDSNDLTFYAPKLM